MVRTCTYCCAFCCRERGIYCTVVPTRTSFYIQGGGLTKNGGSSKSGGSPITAKKIHRNIKTSRAFKQHQLMKCGVYQIEFRNLEPQIRKGRLRLTASPFGPSMSSKNPATKSSSCTKPWPVESKLQRQR